MKINLALIDEYYNQLNNLKNDLEIIKSHLLLRLGMYDDPGCAEPYRIHLAIDFYDLFEHLFPIAAYSLTKMISRDEAYSYSIIKNQCLFSGFFKDLKLILLPPYEYEMNSTFIKFRLEMEKSLNSLDSDPYKLRNAYKNIIKFMNKEKYENLNEFKKKDLEILFEFIGSSFNDLFAICSTSLLDSFTKIERLFKNEIIYRLHDYPLNITLDQNIYLTMQKNFG